MRMELGRRQKRFSMVDTLTPDQRSERMRLIKGKDTRPELVVRKKLWELGFRGYRLHRKNLPGKPDIAFIGRRKAIFVHGCFWHGHQCRLGVRQPKSNREYWLAKRKRNLERDNEVLDVLLQADWDVLVIWECEINDTVALRDRLKKFLKGPP